MFLLFYTGFVVFIKALILAMNSGTMMTGTIKWLQTQAPAFFIIFGGQYG
jgi:hypothetical protein